MPVEWTRLSGETVEELVAVLLCRDNPAAQLIRPSSGDGGLDVLVPLSRGGVEVHQVKKFSSNLTNSQKSQIQRSFERLVSHRSETGLDVRQWHLTMPLNPTRENLEWLAELGEGAEFDCDWRGLNFVDGLAAKYPDVIDYYLRDGADRLERVVSQLTNAIGLPAKEGGAGQVAPSQIANYLLELEPLLDSDPHFRYGLSLDPVMPEPRDEPGLLAAVSRGVSGPDGAVVTVRVYPRFQAALEFRKIPLNVEIIAERGTQLEKDLAAFHRYGTPLHAPMGTVNFTADLPGGMDGRWEGGSARIGPSTTLGATNELRLAAVSPDGQVKAEVLVDLAPATVGLSAEGARAHGTDKQSVFSIELLRDLTDDTAGFKVTTADLTGRRPGDVIQSVRFLSHLRPPNGLAIAETYGPIEGTPAALEYDSNWIDPEESERMLFLLDTLIRIQKHTSVQLTIPPPGAITGESVDHWVTARRLLEGEVVRLEAAAPVVHLIPGAGPPQGTLPFSITSELSIQIGDHVVQLGTQLTECDLSVADLSTLVQHDDHYDVTITPADGATVTIRLTPRS